MRILKRILYIILLIMSGFKDERIDEIIEEEDI